jgi:diguanylate cyclase (GGDEF)-like protein
MALAAVLRSANLVERADEILLRLSGGGDPGVEMLIAEEEALLSAHWATVLLLMDRPADAAVQLRAVVVRALATQRWARLAGHSAMLARGELLEAYGWLHFGEPALAVSLARSAAAGFDAQPELLETHLLHLVLGSPAAAQDRLAARAHLEALVREAEACRRGVWVAAGRAALADLDAAEHGQSEGARMWREVARSALSSVWAEREARFAALRDQDSIRALTAEADRYSHLMLEDPLTGLGNRRMLTRFTGPDRPGCAVFVDVDEFKLVNDVFSHDVGDAVLRTVADLLRSVARAEDHLLRYGGDEFVVLAAGDEAVARTIAHRVREAVSSYPWSKVAPGLRVTVSVGAGAASSQGSDPLLAADRALLAAKREGRNRVVLAF